MRASSSLGRAWWTGFFAVCLAVTPLLAEINLDRDPPSSVGECDSLVLAHPREYEAWRCYVLAARRHQLWIEAIGGLEARLAVDPENPFALLNLGWIEADRSQPRAADLLDRAARGFEALGEAEGEVLARNTLAHFLRRQGRHEESEEQISLALRVAEASGDPRQRAVVRVQQGWTAYERGDYAGAITHFESVAAELPPESAGRFGADVHRSLGMAAWSAGRLEEALSHFRRAAEHHRGRGDRFSEAGERYNIALVAGQLLWRTPEGLVQIRALIDEAVGAARLGGNPGAEASARLLRAQDRGLDMPTRIRETERALELQRAAGLSSESGFALRLLANHLANHDFERNAARIFDLLDEAIRIARQQRSQQDEARAWIVRAGLGAEGRTREEVVEDYLAAIEVVEKMRDLQLDQLARARFLWNWAFVYYRASGFLLEPLDQVPSDDDAALAFEIMERLRARILLDALDSAQATRAAGGEGEDQRRRDEILKEIAALQRSLLVPGITAAELETALGELDRLEVRETELRERIGKADPRYGMLRKPQLPSIEQIRQSLASDQAMLAYQLSNRERSDRAWNWNGGSWVFVLTRDAARVLPLDEQHDLEDRVAVFLGSIERRDLLEREAASRVYADLLAEPLAELGPEVTRLLIIPDGVLHRLPFGALAGSPDSEPLASSYDIGIAPSAALWYHWRSTPPAEAGRSALALADPELPGFAGSAPADRSVSLFRGDLGPLPHARSEARALVDQLGGQSRLLAGREASERFLKQADLRRFAVIHLATHAVVDDREPQRSAVLLAPGAKEEDGLLQMREVVSLDLEGPLVILSACSSVSGELTQGEGVVGLARAFFQAGARTVVGGLWPLRDEEAAGLVRDLARHLGQGASVGAALAAARRERIAAGEPPAAWAGLVALGDADWVPLPGGRRPANRGALWAATILLVLGVLTAAVLYVRRASR